MKIEVDTSNRTKVIYKKIQTINQKNKISPENRGMRGFARRSGQGYATAAPLGEIL